VWARVGPNGVPYDVYWITRYWNTIKWMAGLEVCARVHYTDVVARSCRRASLKCARIACGITLYTDFGRRIVSFSNIQASTIHCRTCVLADS
jgi:hypothetical protein